MDDLLTVLVIFIVLLSIIIQFFISTKKTWERKKKFALSISLFLFMSIVNISLHIILDYLPYAPISGIVLVFTIAWGIFISIIAGVLQIITAIVASSISRKKDSR
ncbi:hypothetical protein [Ornithinibacillus halotolerans]|uniref:Uncharacterized protein n=1 Tax=Ornithinibacillus halotolerans TaxID=1274357 RepID=A0A916S7J6_9BACI|nr:hypothetical protein [Ornithinibacillus halotolerans]GGA87122.1 hypothetical protein GCM10008025_32460 [Ornithinibacillus halotolerans]